MNNGSKIESTEVGWEETVVMICTKCGNQFQSENQKNSPERIKSDLKAKVKSELIAERVRVITTSCLNICPEQKIAISVASINDPGIFKGYAVETEISADELFKKIF